MTKQVPPSFYRLPPSIPRDAWHELLRALLEGEDWFGLVWRDGCEPSGKACAAGLALSRLKIEKTRADRWPGNRLSDSLATVIRYRASMEAFPTLSTSNSPYDWRLPDLPEDLFFGSDRAGLAFVSVAHEGDAWIVRRRYAKYLGQKVTLEKGTLLSRATLPWCLATRMAVVLGVPSEPVARADAFGARGPLRGSGMVARRSAPDPLDSMTDIERLQAWYLAQCDGEWEHGFGPTISTLDNPGWSVKVDLKGTELFEKPFSLVGKGNGT